LIPFDLLNFNTSNAIPTAMITKAATPASIPAFAPVPRPFDTTSGCEADAVAVFEVDNAEAEETDVAERTVDVGPTVAASSKMLFLSPQQTFSPQHQFSPPQFHTSTLPHWSAYYVVLLATFLSEKCGDIPLAYCIRLQDNMDCSTGNRYSPVLPRLAQPQSFRRTTQSFDKVRWACTHHLRCRRLQHRYGSSCSMRNMLLHCCMGGRLG
jgi:hypothetical protein